MSKVTCSVVPMNYVAPYFPSNSVTPTVQHRTEFKSHILEFNVDEVFIFASYPYRTTRRAYRQEYVGVKALPVSEIISRVAYPEQLYTHNGSRWETFIQGPSSIRANLTMSENMVQEYIFEERTDDDGRSYIKFSLTVYSAFSESAQIQR